MQSLQVHLAKLQSLDDAAVLTAGKYERATATVAKAHGETTTAKEQWQSLAPKQM